MGDLLAKKWWLFCNRMRGPMESPGIGRLYFTRGWNPICNPQVKFVFNLIRKEWRNFYCKEPKSSWFPRTYLCNIFLSTSSPIENWFPIFYWISLLCRPKALLCIRPAFRTRQSPAENDVVYLMMDEILTDGFVTSGEPLMLLQSHGLSNGSPEVSCYEK